LPAAARIPDFVLLPPKPESERFVVPLRGPLESGFGYRWGRLHSGIDIAVLGTDKVRASLAGLVTAVGWLPNYSGYGLVVRMRHRDGVRTLYAHLARATVNERDWVEAGELIGRAGCTGSCTGAHLHFEVRLRGKLVDPLRYLGHRVRPLGPSEARPARARSPRSTRVRGSRLGPRSASRPDRGSGRVPHE
jgi:murein DD-endopeptidase MepM/ murein hydrolase activator NlpD